MTILFLLSHQRSGSHFLKQTLNCHNEYLDQIQFAGAKYIALPEVLTPGSEQEHPGQSDWLFAPFLRERVLADPAKWGNPEGIATAACLFVERIRALADGKIVVADIKLNQLFVAEGWYHEVASPPQLLTALRKTGKIIFLRRRNLIRTIVSAMQARCTGVWHVRDQSSAAAYPAKITVDVDEFLRRLSQIHRGIEAVDAWMGESQQSVLKVEYEDLYDAESLQCNSQAFDRIAEFAGLGAGIAWHSAMRRTGTYRLVDVVENFDEFCSRLQMTRFAGMLDEEFCSSTAETAA